MIDLRRASVLVLAFIILLAFFTSFWTAPQQVKTAPLNVTTYNIQMNTIAPQNPYSYIYNKTIVLAPSISDLAYVHGEFANTKPPSYQYDGTTLFYNFSVPNTTVLNLLLWSLSRNASVITPRAYGDLLSIANSGYVEVLKYANTTLQPFPLNANDTEHYSKWAVIVVYAKEFKAPPGFQLGWSYPPSDEVQVGAMSYKIINETSVNTMVQAFVTGSGATYYLYSDYVPMGNNVYYVYNYYSETYYGIAYLYANGKIIEVLQWSYTFNPSDSHSWTLTGYVTVPPGVEQEVQGTFTATTTPYYVPEGSYQQNNITYYVWNVYPSTPSITTQSYTYTWYEYNVTVPLTITVYNGTNPITVVQGHNYNGGHFTANVWFTFWSSNPNQNVTTVTTYDFIQVANYTVERTWNAGNITVIPHLQVSQVGNSIVYYLTFTLKPYFTSPPPWIFQSMTYNPYATISWFYLEQNASLAHALYEYIMHTINQSDQQYWKFEYFVLASEFVMYNFNTTYSVINNLLELESFYINWSTTVAKVMNLSAFPKAQYVPFTLFFFNVSRIPQIYNSSVYFNVTGNYEVYLTDVLNALEYSHYNKVPFGNLYYFKNYSSGKLVYVYLNSTGDPIPYLGEPIYFYYANYVPEIYYAIFQYPPGYKTVVTAIWNGTAWITSSSTTTTSTMTPPIRHNL